MPLDLEEQEQVDQLKAFWAKYRNIITSVLTAVLVIYAGYTAYEWWRNNQAEEASKLYNTLVTSIGKGDKEQTLRAADDLEKQYSRTTYASMASLVAAKVSTDNGNTDKAIDYLRWTADHASSDAYEALGKLRLVTQLIERGTAKDFAEADSILKDKPVKGFEALWLERRGDWYLAQQKVADAKQSYEAAWKQLDQTKEFPEEGRRLLKVKLDAVGGVTQ